MIDCFVMIGISFLLLAIAWTGFVLRRWEGGVLVAIYGAYLLWLWPKS